MRASSTSIVIGPAIQRVRAGAATNFPFKNSSPLAHFVIGLQKGRNPAHLDVVDPVSLPTACGSSFIQAVGVVPGALRITVGVAVSDELMRTHIGNTQFRQRVFRNIEQRLVQGTIKKL